MTSAYDRPPTRQQRLCGYMGRGVEILKQKGRVSPIHEQLAFILVKVNCSLTASQWNCSSKNLEVPSVRFATKKVKKYIFSLVTFMHQSGLRLGKVNSHVSSCIKTYLCIILKFAYRQLNGLCAI